jgi:hypothetical protein
MIGEHHVLPQDSQLICVPFATTGLLIPISQKQREKLQLIHYCMLEPLIVSANP